MRIKKYLVAVLFISVTTLFSCTNNMPKTESGSRFPSSARSPARDRVPGSCKIDRVIQAVCSVQYFGIKPKSINQKYWKIEKSFARYTYSASSWEDCFTAAVELESDRKYRSDDLSSDNLKVTYNAFDGGIIDNLCGKTFLERIGFDTYKDLKVYDGDWAKGITSPNGIEFPSYAKWVFEISGITAAGTVNKNTPIDNPMAGDQLVK